MLSLNNAARIAQRLLDCIEGGHKEDVNDIETIAKYILELAKKDASSD